MPFLILFIYLFPKLIKIELDHCGLSGGPLGKCLHQEREFCNFSQQSAFGATKLDSFWMTRSWGMCSGSPPGAPQLLGLRCNSSFSPMRAKNTCDVYVGFSCDGSWCITLLAIIAITNLGLTLDQRFGAEQDLIKPEPFAGGSIPLVSLVIITFPKGCRSKNVLYSSVQEEQWLQTGCFGKLLPLCLSTSWNRLF